MGQVKRPDPHHYKTVMYRIISVDNIPSKVKRDKLNLIKPLVHEGRSFVAGGVFKHIINDTPDFTPRDIDVFFYKCEHHTAMFDRFAQLSKRENPRYVYSHANGKSISYKNVETKINVDLVMRKYGEPTDILNDFDFTIVKAAAYISNNDYRIIYHSQFFEDMEQKILNYQSTRPFEADGLFNRMIKYIRYGFTPSIEFKTRLFDEIQNTHKSGSKLTPPPVTQY